MPSPLMAQRVLHGVRSVTLPKNLQRAPDVLIEDFEVAGDWTAGAGSLAANTTAGQFRTGTQSIKLTTPSGSAGQMTKTISLDGIGNYEFLGLYYYVHNWTTTTSIKVILSSTTDFSKTMYYTIAPGSHGLASFPIQWQVYRMPISDWTATGGEVWTNTMIRLRFEVTPTSGAVAVSLDDLEGGYKRIPVVVLYHDDGYGTLYTGGAFQYMRARGIPGTLYLTKRIVTDVSTELSTSNIQEIYAAGWSISNHGLDMYVGMGSLSETRQEEQIGGPQIWIRNILGTPGAERHFSYNGNTGTMNNTDSVTALSNCQALTSRLGYGSNGRVAYFPTGNLMEIEQLAINSYNLAQWQAKIDDVITHGQFLFAGVDKLDGASMTSATYKTFIDYVYAKQKAGQIYAITVDEFYRLTLGPVTLGQKPTQPASTWVWPDQTFDITHESNDLTEYDQTTTDSGNMSVSDTAALNGTNYGMLVTLTGTTNKKYGERRLNFWNNETDFRVQFSFDPNTCTLAATQPQVLRIYDAAAHQVMAVTVDYSTNYRARIETMNDALTINYGTLYSMSDAPHYIEVQLHRSSADGVSDAYGKLWIDGILKYTTPTFIGYTLFGNMNRMWFGLTGSAGAGQTGDFYCDELSGNRTGTQIGPDVGSRSFNGTTDRITWATPWSPGLAAPITISAWVKLSSAPANGYIFCMHVAGDGSAGVVFNITTDILYFIRSGTTTLLRPSAASTITTSTWTHVLVTHDGAITTAANAHLYKNGTEVSYGAATNGASETSPAGSYSLGGRIYDDARNFPGLIAQVGVWDRVLDATEIANISSTYAPSLVSSGLKYYFKGNTSDLHDEISDNLGTADGTSQSTDGPGVIY